MTKSDPFVICTACGKKKCPLGRDPGAVMVNSYCSWDCDGYQKDPKPSTFWPGERDENEKELKE